MSPRSGSGLSYSPKPVSENRTGCKGENRKDRGRAGVRGEEKGEVTRVERRWGISMQPPNEMPRLKGGWVGLSQGLGGVILNHEFQMNFQVSTFPLL